MTEQPIGATGASRQPAEVIEGTEVAAVPDVAEVTAEDRIRAGFPRSEDEQRADLEAVREDLGDTVEELVRRVDVPARVKEKRDQTVADARRLGLRARAEAETRVPASRVLFERPVIPAAAGGVLLVVLLVVRAVRRRSTSA